jgi:CHAD domain-containing protein
MARAKVLNDLDPKAPTGQNARCIARIRLDEMYNWSADVDKPYEVRGLHNLRIAAKRLRYTLEIFEDALPAACQAVREELTQIQDELGTLHDSDVIIALLRLCLGGEDAGVAYEVALVEAGKQTCKG